VKGEIVIVIDPPAETELLADPATVYLRASELAARGERSKTIAKLLAQEFGIPRNEAYEIALAAHDHNPNAQGDVE
jgi:16S rRNA (cytidine1402-2'-O)-methyltransferase